MTTQASRELEQRIHEQEQAVTKKQQEVRKQQEYMANFDNETKRLQKKRRQDRVDGLNKKQRLQGELSAEQGELERLREQHRAEVEAETAAALANETDRTATEETAAAVDAEEANEVNEANETSESEGIKPPYSQYNKIVLVDELRNRDVHSLDGKTLDKDTFNKDRLIQALESTDS